MSTLRADTIANRLGTKSVPADTVVDGTAKAWVNFNGTGTVAIRRAFNVSSITDHGPGEYTLNFTTPMIDAGYAFVFGAGTPSIRRNAVSVSQVAGAVLAGSLRIDVLQYPINTADDATQIAVAIFS